MADDTTIRESAMADDTVTRDFIAKNPIPEGSPHIGVKLLGTEPEKTKEPEANVPEMDIEQALNAPPSETPTEVQIGITDTEPTFANKMKAHYYMGRGDTSTSATRDFNEGYANWIKDKVEAARKGELGSIENFVYNELVQDPLNEEDLAAKINWSQEVLARDKDENPWYSKLRDLPVDVAASFAGAIEENPLLELGKLAAGADVHSTLSAVAMLFPGSRIAKMVAGAVGAAAGAVVYGELGRAATKEYKETKGESLTPEQISEARLTEAATGAIVGAAAPFVAKGLRKGSDWISDYVEAWLGRVKPSLLRKLKKTKAYKQAEEYDKQYAADMNEDAKNLREANKAMRKQRAESKALKKQQQKEAKLQQEPPPSPPGEPPPPSPPTYQSGDAARTVLERGGRNFVVGDIAQHGGYSILDTGPAIPGEPYKPRYQLDPSKALKDTDQIVQELAASHKIMLDSFPTRAAKMKYLYKLLNKQDTRSRARKDLLKSQGLYRDIELSDKQVKNMTRLFRDVEVNHAVADRAMTQKPLPSDLRARLTPEEADLLEKIGDNVRRTGKATIDAYHSLGLPLQPLEGWLPQDNNPSFIALGGKDKWARRRYDTLDLDRTFSPMVSNWNSLSDAQKRARGTEILKDIYKDLVANDGFAGGAGTGTGARLSQQRILHPRDGRAYVEYADEYSARGGNVLSAAHQHLESTANALGLYEALGNNPLKMVDDLIYHINDTTREAAQQAVSSRAVEGFIEYGVRNMRDYLAGKTMPKSPTTNPFLHYAPVTVKAVAQFSTNLLLKNAYVFAAIEEPITSAYANILTPQGLKKVDYAVQDYVTHNKNTRELSLLGITRDIDRMIIGENWHRDLPGKGGVTRWFDRAINNRFLRFGDSISKTHEYSASVKFATRFGEAIRDGTPWDKLKGAKDLLLETGITKHDWDNVIIPNANDLITHWTPSDMSLSKIMQPYPILNVQHALKNVDMTPEIENVAIKLTQASAIFVARNVITSKSMSSNAITNQKFIGALKVILPFKGYLFEKIAQTIVGSDFENIGSAGARTSRWIVLGLITGMLMYTYDNLIRGRTPKLDSPEDRVKALSEILRKGDVLPIISDMVEGAYTGGASGALKGALGGKQSGGPPWMSLVIGGVENFTDAVKNAWNQDTQALVENLADMIPGTDWGPTDIVMNRLVKDSLISMFAPEAVDIFNNEIAKTIQYKKWFHQELFKPGAFTNLREEVNVPSEEYEEANIRKAEREEMKREEREARRAG